MVKQSFLKNHEVEVIPSGVDLHKFHPVESNLLKQYNLSGKKIILGCANIWSARKGLEDFKKLRDLLDKDFEIVLIGINAQQMAGLAAGITGISRTENVEELAQWYSLAMVFVNPTQQDNFPTTNIEALACGTPVITYNTGGSPEAIDEETGFVIEKGDVNGIIESIRNLEQRDMMVLSKACRLRAEHLFDRKKRSFIYLRTGVL